MEMGSRGAQLRAAAARGDVGSLSSLLLVNVTAGTADPTAPANPQARGASNEPNGDGAGNGRVHRKQHRKETKEA